MVWFHHCVPSAVGKQTVTFSHSRSISFAKEASCHLVMRCVSKSVWGLQWFYIISLSERSTTDFIKAATSLSFQSVSKNNSDLKYCIFGVTRALIIKKSESRSNGRYKTGSMFTSSRKKIKIKTLGARFLVKCLHCITDILYWIYYFLDLLLISNMGEWETKGRD